jgi:ribulose-phosphate 3-epimerase
MNNRIAPSILAADFANLSSEVEEVVEAGIDIIHIDVMDGHFVPNLSMGPHVVSAVRPLTTAELDVHLMITEPDRYIEAFANAGADYLTVHAEVCQHLHRTIQVIKENGMKAGVALNPATPVCMIEPVLPELDLILIMTVNPGFGGQTFIKETLNKIKDLKEKIAVSGKEIIIEVDGGINAETLPQAKAAGADLFVAGSAVFNEPDRRVAIQTLNQL